MPEFEEIKENKLFKFITDKKISMVLLKVFISAGFLLYIIYKVNFAQIFITIAKANLVLITAAFILTALNLYLQFKKWQMACVNLLHSNNKKKIWISLFYGIAAGSFTPVRVGEFFGRSIEFRDKSLLQVTFATIVDKLFLLFVISFCGSISSLFFLRYYFHFALSTIFIFLFIILLVFGFISLMIFKPELLNSTILKRIQALKIIISLRDKLKDFKSLDKIFAVKMILVSALFYAVFILQYAILVAAFSGNSNFFMFLWAGVLVMFTKSMITPFTFIDFGIREGASVFFLTKMGELSTVAFNAPAILFFINIIIPSTIGVILFYKRDNA
ncbi:MAG: lysylphosphatidylglycerol synthase domain-containing protein [Ignavibacteriaceae bacterium]|nr:lysylphosphatidylglycerol synthase domain-containing protein [Ignavibacteriaceae bacterium]